jgi:hypothetical protein
MTMLRRVVALIAVAVSLALALSAVRYLADAPVKVNPNVQLSANETYSVGMWVAVPAMPHSELFVQAIEELVATFTATQTNVTVTTTFVPAQELEGALREALARGEPPDVLVNSAPSPADYGALQVPLGLYLSPAEKERLPPAIIAQLSASGELATLPLAYTFRVFAANPAVLRAAGADIDRYGQNGWTWNDFFAVVDTLNRRGKRGLVLTNAELPLLRSLAASLGKPSPFGAGGGLEWGLSELQALGETARRLAPAANLSAGNAIAADEDALARFLGGQAGLIGPLNPELTRWLLSAAQKRGLTPLLLPVPFLGPTPVVDIAAVSVVLFRQAAFRGHRHTRAAAELAKHLSANAAPVFDTHLALLARHTEGAAYANLSLAPAAPYYPAWVSAQQPHGWEQALLPLWLRLSAGELSPSEFATEAYSVLSAFLR